jgi:hypothetical protein
MFDQPEYVHVLINHFPLIGLLVAMVALIAALITRSRTSILIGLGLVCLLALSIWPVSYFGDAGHDRVLSMTDAAGAQFLHHHQALADRWSFLYYVTAGVAGLGFILAWKWPRTLVAFSLLALVLAAASLAAGIAIAKDGGAIRHREFRFTPSPPPPA